MTAAVGSVILALVCCCSGRPAKRPETGSTASTPAPAKPTPSPQRTGGSGGTSSGSTRAQGTQAAVAPRCASADAPDTNRLAVGRTQPGVIEAYARYGATSTFVLTLQQDGAMTFRVPANGAPLFPAPEIGLFVSPAAPNGQKLHASLAGALADLKGTKTLRPGEASWWVVSHASSGKVERTFRLYDESGEFRVHHEAMLGQVHERWNAAREHTVAAHARWLHDSNASAAGEVVVRVQLRSTGRLLAVLGKPGAASSWRLLSSANPVGVNPERVEVLNEGIAACPLVAVDPGSSVELDLVFRRVTEKSQLAFTPSFPKGKTATDSWVAGTIVLELPSQAQ